MKRPVGKMAFVRGEEVIEAIVFEYRTSNEVIRVV